MLLSHRMVKSGSVASVAEAAACVTLEHSDGAQIEGPPAAATIDLHQRATSQACRPPRRGSCAGQQFPNGRQPKCSATMRSILATADMSLMIRLRITATATPESMSAYAALPLEPIIPKVDPGRDWKPPSRAGL